MLAASALASALATACATLPEPHRPVFVDQRIDARFAIGDDGRLPVPTTTRELIVYELAFEPDPTEERFDSAGNRWFTFPPGTSVRVTTRIRCYTDDEIATATLRGWLDRAAETAVESR